MRIDDGMDDMVYRPVKVVKRKKMADKRKKGRNVNMGWAKTMVRKSNQRCKSDDIDEIKRHAGFCAGLRYAVAAAGFKYGFNEEKGFYEVLGRRKDE